MCLYSAAALPLHTTDHCEPDNETPQNCSKDPRQHSFYSEASDATSSIFLIMFVKDPFENRFRKCDAVVPQSTDGGSVVCVSARVCVIVCVCVGITIWLTN